MIFHQYYLACLSHASYLIGDESTGRAVVVDPQRDVAGYLADAARLGLRIERVIETHVHADFLSGHLELAARTGAAISYGEPAQAAFPIELVRDGDRIGLGAVHLEIRATPGHTPESISVLVFERRGHTAPVCVLTGDTLFVGDVGRPDLLATDGATSAEAMARLLYRSLHDTLLRLPDATEVYPAHGAGSACGRNLSTETRSTIGEQRRSNPALAPMSEEAFVELVCRDQPVAPPYFAYDARRNRERRPLLDELGPPRALDLATFQRFAEAGAVILDTRPPDVYADRHLRASLNVGLEGRFAEHAGAVLRPEQDVVLVCEPGHELEAKVRLGRIGFDRVAGCLADVSRVLAAHPALTTRSARLTAAALARQLAERADTVVVDVRNPAERAGGTIPGAVPLPLARLLDSLDDIDPDRPVVVYCASGHRSCTAASLITSAGHPHVADLLGGYAAWRSLHDRSRWPDAVRPGRAASTRSSGPRRT